MKTKSLLLTIVLSAFIGFGIGRLATPSSTSSDNNESSEGALPVVTAKERTHVKTIEEIFDDSSLSYYEQLSHLLLHIEDLESDHINSTIFELAAIEDSSLAVDAITLVVKTKIGSDDTLLKSLLDSLSGASEDQRTLIIHSIYLSLGNNFDRFWKLANDEQAKALWG